MWPRRQVESFPPDASPPRCAQLMGFASRGCLVIVLGATAERRNLFFRSDLGLPWIRSLSLRLSRYTPCNSSLPTLMNQAPPLMNQAPPCQGDPDVLLLCR